MALSEREKIFEGILRVYYQWSEYASIEGLYSITIKGEEFSFFDILDGMNILPLRQRQAVWLICVEGLKYREAAELMGYRTSTTPAQFIKDEGIKKLAKYYDSEVFRRNSRNHPQRKSGKLEKKSKPILLCDVFPGLVKDTDAT